MSQHVVTRTKAFLAAGALGSYLRVIVSSTNTLSLAGAADVETGVTERQAFAANDPLSIHLQNGQGTMIMTANGAITRGNPVYAAAAGKVSATGAIKVGTALETVTTDGDYLEVLPEARHGQFQLSSVAAVTAAGSTQADAAALPADNNFVTGADGTKGAVLPTAVPGMRILVKSLTGGSVLKVYPATGGAINAIAANSAISMASLTSAIFVASSATQWYTEPLLPS